MTEASQASRLPGPSASSHVGTSQRRRWFRPILVGVAVLMIVRTAALVAMTDPRRELTGDEPAIYSIATNVLAGRGITHQEAPWITRPPGWPLVVAATRAVFGDNLRVIVGLQGLFDVGSAVLWASTARLVWSSWRAAIAVCLFVLLWPPYFRESRFIQTEPCFAFLLAATSLAYVQLLRRPSGRVAVLLGALAGAAALVRPPAVLVFIGMILGWMVVGQRERVRRKLLLSGLALLALAVTISPLAIRNAQVTGRFIPLSVGTGDMMFVGTMEETDGRWNQQAWKRARKAAISLEERRLGHTLGPVEQDNLLRKIALDHWREDPGTQVSRAIRRLGRLVLVPLDAGERPLLRFGFLAALLMLYAAALPQGIRSITRSDNGFRVAGALLVTILVYVVATAGFYTNSRYMEPLRPILAVLAAGWLVDGRRPPRTRSFVT